MAKKLYVVCGVGVNFEDEREYTDSFCNVFRSEKKADRYYDKMYIRLLEQLNAGSIKYYNIHYETFKK